MADRDARSHFRRLEQRAATTQGSTIDGQSSRIYDPARAVDETLGGIEEMGLSRDDIVGTITPLRFIFWGALACVLDVRIVTGSFNGVSFEFDILSDLVGLLLITFGVFKLAAVQVHPRYASAMMFVKAVAVLETAAAVAGSFIDEKPPPLSLLYDLLGLAELIAIVVFCVAMRWLCTEARLRNSARSWTTTIWLFTMIVVIPVGLLSAAGYVALLMGTSFDIDLGPAGLLLLSIFLVPLVHLFMSTSRMRKEAWATAPA